MQRCLSLRKAELYQFNIQLLYNISQSIFSDSPRTRSLVVRGTYTRGTDCVCLVFDHEVDELSGVLFLTHLYGLAWLQ